MTRRRGYLELNLWLKLLDKIGDKVSVILFYHQGEPYLAPDLLMAVHAAHRKKIYTTCSSNGHFITPEKAYETVLSGLDTLLISWDGLDQKSYSTYRRNGSFKKVQQAIKNLQNAKAKLQSKTPYIILQCLVHRYNENQQKRILEQGKAAGIERILFKNIQVTTVEEARNWLPQNNNFSRYKIKNEHLELQRKPPVFCPRPWTTSLINWDGRIVPCCFDKNATYVMGGLLRSCFSTIWHGQSYRHFRQNMLANKGSLTICKNCNQGLRIWLSSRKRSQNEN